MDSKFSILNDLSKKIEDELDFDFSVNEIRIEDMQQFYTLIKEPFDRDFGNQDRKLFYRGERINDPARPLMPTLLRDRKKSFLSKMYTV